VYYTNDVIEGSVLPGNNKYQAISKTFIKNAEKAKKVLIISIIGSIIDLVMQAGFSK
jgi:hypothetical protein